MKCYERTSNRELSNLREVVLATGSEVEEKLAKGDNGSH